MKRTSVDDLLISISDSKGKEVLEEKKDGVKTIFTGNDSTDVRLGSKTVVLLDSSELSLATLLWTKTKFKEVDVFMVETPLNKGSIFRGEHICQTLGVSGVHIYFMGESDIGFLIANLYNHSTIIVSLGLSFMEELGYNHFTVGIEESHNQRVTSLTKSLDYAHGFLGLRKNTKIYYPFFDVDLRTTEGAKKCYDFIAGFKEGLELLPHSWKCESDDSFNQPCGKCAYCKAKKSI